MFLKIIYCSLKSLIGSFITFIRGIYFSIPCKVSLFTICIIKCLLKSTTLLVFIHFLFLKFFNRVRFSSILHLFTCTHFTDFSTLFKIYYFLTFRAFPNRLFNII
nr:MAG TPA: hypothetical protein [Bacteriophage sp.]